MRFTYSVLKLLALCRITLASPCKPSSTITSVAPTSTTETSETVSSTAFIYETTATTEFETLSDSSTIATSIATSSVEVETTTTTTAASGPTNLISNPGFEDSTVAPWTVNNNIGALAIDSDSGFPPSTQAGHFSASGENLVNLGIRQEIDSSLIVADKEYRFSIYTKVTASNFCISQTIACGAGTGWVNSANWGAVQTNGWILTTVTCTWNQAQRDAGPSIQVAGVLLSNNLFNLLTVRGDPFSDPSTLTLRFHAPQSQGCMLSRKDIIIVVMRLAYRLLQLLTLHQLASASPCKPSSQPPNSVTSIRTTSSSEAETTSTDISSASSTTTEPATSMVLSSTILSVETESVTPTTVFSSASAGETESSSIASSETTTIAESTTKYEPLVYTTSAATSAETSTEETSTTTTSIERQPTNLIRNPGFEDLTFAPWKAVVVANRGWLSIRSDTSRPGSLQCGVFDSSVPPTGGLRRRLIQPIVWSVKQDIDPSTIITGKEYRFSIFQKTTASGGCNTQRLGCGGGGTSVGSGEFGGPLNAWALGAISCTWNQAQLDAGPYVYVNIICNSVTFSLDDAVLIEREASQY
ncbi:hypothetical protein NOF04DRAFT_1373347 [Fusarium oxysporum II5]|nr:hypothetical protein NOF04DRAFT_1373347 [Fusarium oxysporum II5]